MRRIAGILAMLLVPVAAAAQTDAPRTISVNGQGTVEKEPEQGVVLFAVESEAQTARAAADANAERMTQLTTALRRARVPERNIRTVSYQLRPEYVYPQDRSTDQPRIVGYRAVNTVQVTVDTVARMGSIIDTAIANGANRVASISFSLRDPQAAQREALDIAIRNARRDAEAAAAAAGESLGEVLNINIGGFHVPGPAPMYAARAEMMDASAVSTPIETGTLTIVATVNMVYRIATAR